jgi:hypothetical protein
MSSGAPALALSAIAGMTAGEAAQLLTSDAAGEDAVTCTPSASSPMCTTGLLPTSGELSAGLAAGWAANMLPKLNAGDAWICCVGSRCSSCSTFTCSLLMVLDELMASQAFCLLSRSSARN